MIATPAAIDPAVLTPPAPSANFPSHSVPSCLSASVPSHPSPLSDHDEKLLTTLLDASFSLSAVARHHQLTLQKLMDWWRQPHVKAAVKELTELSQSRATLIATDDATRACTALQSCTVLSDVEFYEQADPPTRQRAFESARKAAGAVLRLAGLPRPVARRATPRPPNPEPTPEFTPESALTRCSPTPNPRPPFSPGSGRSRAPAGKQCKPELPIRSPAS